MNRGTYHGFEREDTATVPDVWLHRAYGSRACVGERNGEGIARRRGEVMEGQVWPTEAPRRSGTMWAMSSGLVRRGTVIHAPVVLTMREAGGKRSCLAGVSSRRNVIDRELAGKEAMELDLTALLAGTEAFEDCGV